MPLTPAEILFRVVAIRRSDGAHFVIREKLYQDEAEHILGVLPPNQWEPRIERMVSNPQPDADY